MTGDGKFGWYYSLDEEEYNKASSREEAIEDGTQEALEHGHTTFYICEADKEVLRDDIFDADHVLDRFEERNDDCWPEGFKSPDIDQAACEELEKRLNETFSQWRKEFGKWESWNFYTTRNREIIRVELPKDESA